jgi:hypothetical protein
MVRGGSYGEYVTRTVNPGQTLTITVQGNQIIDITPPIVITPPPPPPPVPPVTYDQTVVFKHETGYNTPIEYLILYRDNGVAWNNSAKNTGYVGVGSGIYYLYTRTPGSNAIAADSGTLTKGLPNRPSNYGPTKQQWVAAPIHGLDNSATTSVLEAVTNRTAPELTGKISVGSLPGVGDYAVKIKGTEVGNWYTTPYGKDHPLLEINDSVIIQFDPPLQRHEIYKFKLNRGTQDAPINWFVSWIGAHHNGSPTSNNVRYNAGYFGDCWFILCPWWHDRSTLNITAKGVALRYE